MRLQTLSALLFVIAAPLPVTFSQTLPAGVIKTAAVEGINEYKFPNGLRVLLFPDPSNPKITVNVTYLVGSRHEGYGESGMAHLLEHLLFMTTSNGRDIKKELVGHGASWNGSTSSDRTNYFETVAASNDNLKWALALEADRMVRSKMEKAILDTEMTVVRNEFERGENSAARVLYERVEATAFLWHNYGKSTIGSRADLENVPIDKLAAFYRKYYQPDNAVLIVAGQITEASALNEIAATLGAIPKPGRKLDATYTTEPTQDGERYVALRRVGDNQEVIIAYHTPAAAHPDSAALEVLAGIMSGGGGRGGAGGAGLGRLTKALVDNKKAISARMSSQQLHDPSLSSLSATLTKEQSLKEAREIMLQTLEGVIKEPPTKEEVDRAKTRMLRGMEAQMANSQQVALGFSEWASMGDWRLLFLNRDRIKTVTPEDVVRVAKTYFVESNRTVGEFIPTAKPERAEITAAPDLDKLFKDYKGGEAMIQGESFDPTPANVETRVMRAALPSGLKLVLLPRKTRGDTVSAALDLHFGDAQSLVGKGPVAAIAGSLLMRGTKTKSRQQIADAMDQLKARVTVSGGGGGGFGGGRRGGPPPVVSDASGATASIDTTKENLIGALKLAVELLREPAFAESEFEQVKQQRIAGIESGRSEPASMSALELQRRMSPYAKSDVRYVGTIDEQIEEVRKVTLAGVKQFHAQYYGAANAELVVTGQFDSAEVRKTAAELLGEWKGAPYQRLTSIYKKTDPANVKIETPDKQNANFEAGMRLKLSADDPDYPAMVIMNQMFGGSLAARMPNRIRNLEGLSYGVSSRLAIPIKGEGALWSMTAISAPQNTPKVEASFTDELRKALRDGFTETELATAKSTYRDQQAVLRSQDQTLLRTLAGREQLGRTMKWDEQMDAKVQGLTLEQVNAAMRSHLSVEALTIVKAGDFTKAGAYTK